MTIDAIALQGFLAVADTGSFTQAARKIGRTQSAVSQQIAKLETLFGKPLFTRGKVFSLTPEGELFLSYARQIHMLQQEAIDRIVKPDLKGEIRFGLPEDFASIFLSDLLVNFSRIHPCILLNIECSLTLNLLERFHMKEFDLVLVKIKCPGNAPHSVDVGTEHLEWVGDPNLIQNKQPIPLVLAPQPCVFRARVLEALQKKNMRWRLAFTSPSYTGLVAATKAGLGVTALPRTMIPSDLNLINRDTLPPLEKSHISLLKQVPDNPALNSLEEFIVKKLRH